MIVTEIRPVTKKRSQVWIEGQPAFVLYNGELSRYSIREGGEIAPEMQKEITEELLVKRSRKRALDLLLQADRTKKQLLDKLLQDGYSEELAGQAVAYAESFGYVNDERYARMYAEGAGAKKSRLAVKKALAEKGIPHELIERVLEEQENEGAGDYEKLRALAYRRLGETHVPDEKELRRVYGYLARRGFPSGDIFRVLEEYRQEAREQSF